VHRADYLMISPAADGQHRGLGIDVARLDEMEAAASATWQSKRTTLYQMLKRPVPLPDAKQPYRHTPTIHPILERTLKAPLKKWQKNGTTGEWGERDSCDKTVLEPFKGHPLVDLLLEVKGLDSTRQELAQLCRDVEFAGGRTRPNYKLLGANTGQTTTCGQIRKNNRGDSLCGTEVFKSGKDKGKPKPAEAPSQIGCNFQGLSKAAKRCLVTGNPDTELLDVDWSQQELCLQASPKLYNDPGFRTIILEEVDPHAQIAGAVLGHALEPLGYEDDGKPVWPKERSSIGKPANFGLSYACGVQSLEERIRVKRGAGYREGDGQGLRRLAPLPPAMLRTEGPV